MAHTSQTFTAPVIKGVQSGTAIIPASATSTAVAISPVDPTRSFLTFNFRTGRA